MLRLALDSERAAVAQFNSAAEECHGLGDHGTAAVFEEMVRDEEKHADWFESQLDAIAWSACSATSPSRSTPGRARAESRRWQTGRMIERAASSTAVLVCQGRATADGRYAVGRFSDPVARELLDPADHVVVDRVRADRVPAEAADRMAYEMVRRTGLTMVPRTIAIDDGDP